MNKNDPVELPSGKLVYITDGGNIVNIYGRDDDTYIASFTAEDIRELYNIVNVKTT